MHHYTIYATDLVNLIVNPTGEMLKLLDEYDDLVDVFCCDTDTIIVIPVINREFYNTHPDGQLTTVVYQASLKEIPEDAIDYMTKEKVDQK